MINSFGQQSGIPMFNQSNHPHRRVVSCCMGIPYGIGVPLVLTSWIVGKRNLIESRYDVNRYLINLMKRELVCTLLFFHS